MLLLARSQCSSPRCRICHGSCCWYWCSYCCLHCCNCRRCLATIAASAAAVHAVAIYFNMFSAAVRLPASPLSMLPATAASIPTDHRTPAVGRQAAAASVCANTHLLHNLLLLHQEGTHDAVLDHAGCQVAPVCAMHLSRRGQAGRAGKRRGRAQVVRRGGCPTAHMCM